MSLTSKGFQSLAIGAFAIALGLDSSLAQAGTGDLDPSFADHGRLGSISGVGGEARSVELLQSGGILVGGGDVDASGYPTSEPLGRCTLRIQGSSFTRHLTEDGATVTTFNPAPVPGVEAVAMARQADGRIVVLGRKIELLSSYRCSHSFDPVIFRLETDGLLDSTFGVNGMRQLERLRAAHSLTLDPRGRIVIAGVRWVDDDDPATPGKYESTILRLRPDGRLDGSFGVNGSYVGPAAVGAFFFFYPRPEYVLDAINLTPIGSGGYRISVPSTGGCVIAGITSDGAPDAAFGTDGVATLSSPAGAKVTCHALETATDGSLLVAGSARKHGYVTRLLPSGAPDPGFVADGAISSSMTRVTSIANATDGKLLVAGVGPRGASILRLHAAGERDTAFGDAGRTWIDLNSENVPKPIVRDMAIRDDGSIIAAGGDASSDQPFVVRLLGDAGGLSRGVIGFSRWHAAPMPGGSAVLRVRRSGGNDGNVSARYRTVADLDARGHQDFVPKSGTLTWAAGDTAEKNIAIDIAQRGNSPDAFESFRVMLAGARGGAGLGTRSATVDIQPDGSPGGQIEIDMNDLDAGESSLDGQYILLRNHYFQGRVCVTFTAKSGTAIAGKDFRADPMNVCWDDQDTDWKLPEIEIVDDSLTEGNETFTLELSNPTGGAIIGPDGSATITLYDND